MKNMKIQVVMIGVGYWGKNILRNVLSNPSYDLVGIVDMNLQAIPEDLVDEGLPRFTNLDRLYESGIYVDLAIVTTRPGSHEELVNSLLKHDIDVLVAKPAGNSLNEAERISKLSQKLDKKVFVDYTYLYSPLIRMLMENTRKVGNPISYTSYRTALGIIQADTDVIADLFSHDISILLKLKGKLPDSVQCVAVELIKNKPTNVVSILKWEDGFIALVHSSWNSAKKIRHISLMGDEGTVLVDELDKEKKLKFIAHSPATLVDLDYTIRNISYSISKEEIIDYREEESLSVELRELAISYKENIGHVYSEQRTLISEVWKVIEVARRSVANGGTVESMKI